MYRGGINAGDLTKSRVKFPSIGAKKLVKALTCPHLKRGVSIREFDLLILVQPTGTTKSPRGRASVDVKSPVGEWGPRGGA